MPTRATRRLGLCAALLMLAAGAARAQEAPPNLSHLQKPIYGAEGWYVAISGVYGLEIGGVPRAGDVDGSPGAGLRLGHRFSRWLATELHGEWFNDFAYDGGGFTAWDFMLCERFYPLRTRLQPFVVAGLGVLQKRDHGTGDVEKRAGFTGRFGAGLDIYVNSSLAVSLDAAYVIPFTHIQDHDFIAISLGFQFW